ncbi:unnamed protein product, partial [marine sediment metagenome]
MRPAGEDQLTFAGRVSAGGFDAEAGLLDYYPSLNVAREMLHSDPGLCDAIEAFLQRVSVPHDLRGLLCQAVGLEEAAKKRGVSTDPNETKPNKTKALSDLLPSDRKRSKKVLEEVVRTSSYRLASKSLEYLYEQDLTVVLPLAEADAELGKVEGSAWERRSSFPRSARTTSVVGLELLVNDREDKDTTALVRKKFADLILTETTARNLRLIAAAWRLRHPVLLEGPTSSGKTSAVRYLAFKTQSPYRRINLSYYTDVSDLLGRYVGGERRYEYANLKKKTAAELRSISSHYGIAPAAKKILIPQIMTAQMQPRWVDGPVIRAMKRGEVLLLDELNLARPEIIERLNSLFDDDNNLVLVEHQNEVIEPDERFRIFATMNPVTYSGRERLSEAMRARWNNIVTYGLTQEDLKAILRARYQDQIPDGQLARLIALHDRLAAIAELGIIGRNVGGIAITLRNLFRV